MAILQKMKALQQLPTMPINNKFNNKQTKQIDLKRSKIDEKIKFNQDESEKELPTEKKTII